MTSYYSFFFKIASAKIRIILPTKGQDIHLKQTGGKYEIFFFIRMR